MNTIWAQKFHMLGSLYSPVSVNLYEKSSCVQSEAISEISLTHACHTFTGLIWEAKSVCNKILY